MKGIKDLKQGDIFYESEYGSTVRCIALEDAYERDGGWACKSMVINKTGKNGWELVKEPLEYFIANENFGYGPSITFKEPILI